MVLYVLSVKADLEGIASVALKPGSDICISVRNPTDVNEVRERIVIDPGSLVEPEVPDHATHRSEAPFHLALKWNHGEEKRATVRIVNGSDSSTQNAPKQTKKGSNNNSNDAKLKTLRAMNTDDSALHYVPILALDCDGMEPYAFHPTGNEFIVTTKGGAILDDIELSEGDWSYYDLSGGTSAITNLTSKFE